MNRIGFILRLRPDKINEYKEHHKKVWPEMLEALTKTGWHNYSLFLKEDGTLFGYFETPGTLEDAIEGMSKEEINSKWQALMAPYFVSLDGLHPDQGMFQLEEIFHLD